MLSIKTKYSNYIIDDRLYWCDSLRESISSIFFDGSGRKEEISRPGVLPLDISVHENVMYVTEYILFGR